MALTLARAAGSETPPVRDLTIGDALREHLSPQKTPRHWLAVEE